ncbi:MAG: hypothetical protein IPP15_12505 [Saprospiraceae bacterium]|uniref:Uncharacterized protein n=1 Tax=Candidatus Opimibacter skivensis TaxID=2982028 RepID=A0A9D7SU64_9BACT|nr:hypothetical protein [Candidatus Opimibacter skivensis]
MNNPKNLDFILRMISFYAPSSKYTTVIVTEPILNLASLCATIWHQLQNAESIQPLADWFFTDQ